MTTEQEKIILTYDTVHKMSLELADKIYLHRPDVIIGLSRGGLLPAMIISHELNVPLLPVVYSSNKGNSDSQEHHTKLQKYNSGLPYIEDKTICVVDDIVDTGNTMRDVTTHYMSIGCNNTVFSVSLILKGEYNNNAHIAAMRLPFVSPWIIFPFEKQ